MDGMQIVALVLFVVGLVGLDLAAIRGGFDSRFSRDSKYEHPHTW